MTRVDSDFVQIRKQRKKVKSESEKAIDTAGKFPNCKGLYPDCPEKPSKDNPQCRTCPKLDEVEE